MYTVKVIVFSYDVDGFQGGYKLSTKSLCGSFVHTVANGVGAICSKCPCTGFYATVYFKDSESGAKLKVKIPFFKHNGTAFYSIINALTLSYLRVVKGGLNV